MSRFLRLTVSDEFLTATISLRGVVFAPTDELLVVKRASDRGWELPGGRLGPTEDAAVGVHREIREETGLDVAVEHPVHAISWRNDAGKGRFGVYYTCRASERDVTLSAEHLDSDWILPEEADRRLSDPQTTAVRRAVRRQQS